MQIPPPYNITHHMLKLISQIESNRTIIQTTPIPDQIITNLTHLTLLKSSVFSAQIEGNTLSIDDIKDSPPDKGELEGVNHQEQTYQRQEVENIITALSYLRDKGTPQILDLPFLYQLHRLVMHQLVHTSQTGKLRQEPSAIFDTAGNVVYMTPPPSELNQLLANLLTLINDGSGIFPLIKAPLAHITFEKIHPFLDGNGRVGRLLFQSILARHNYHFNWLLSIEELLQQKKSTYYALLDQTDATEFIEFILQLILEETERIKTQITTTANPTEEDFLLPRRHELLNIIKDQSPISFDGLHRRFLKIPPRTLRYDIQQLEKAGFIKKIGTTRGALYQIKK